jgi:hypothetical protein
MVLGEAEEVLGCWACLVRGGRGGAVEGKTSLRYERGGKPSVTAGPPSLSVTTRGRGASSSAWTSSPGGGRGCWSTFLAVAACAAT